MKPLQRVAFVGNYLPRRCGIATHDLHRAVAMARPALEIAVVAMTDRRAIYAYPKAVRFQVQENAPGDYVRAAEFLNNARFDVVSLQHEYGIFGGEAGGHIVELVSRLKMPIVTTLHTILAEPSPAQNAVMHSLVEASTILVVMAEKGCRLLQTTYGVPAEKIKVIPHGIPEFPFVGPDDAKGRLGFSDKTVILTFGLLSPSKGIETVIEALPGIVKSCPKAVYVVLGATHPNLLRDQGETYREGLLARAQELGVANHVVFINRFVDQRTLLDYISMCDLYVTPYLNEAQMTSGTLAYSFGLGKVVVSTPYWHAKELLADDRGILVPFGDATAIGTEIADLLTDDLRRMVIRERAYAASRSMTWPQTAKYYLAAFEAARVTHRNGKPAVSVLEGPAKLHDIVPEIRIDHLLAMCDSTGLLQHAVLSVPDRSHGYCVDDNARALLFACAPRGPDDPRLPAVLTTRFAAFVQHAWNSDTKRFRNFMSYDRRWLEAAGSEDSHGRTLWALGHCARNDPDAARRPWAAALFAKALPSVEHFTSPRAWAFALLGLDAYCAVAVDDLAAARIRRRLSGRLLGLLSAPRSETWPKDWQWFENVLAYDNARLSQALIETGLSLQEPTYVAAGLQSLRWLMAKQTGASGCFQPIGTSGFGKPFGGSEIFDQQPVEAAATISACLAADRADRSAGWPAQAFRVFAWFLGKNSLQAALADAETGGCLDGLHPDRPNANMGAESVLSYLLGLAEIREFQRISQAKPSQGITTLAVKAFKQTAPIRKSTRGSHIVTIPILEPAFAALAPRPGAGRRPALQTGDGAERPQPNRQDQG
jgi:glycosyltransferase involved in cell wall biosynthesis